MSQAVKSNKNAIFYLKLAIYLLITFGFQFLPPIGQITELGMGVLGVFIGTIFGWIFFEMVWPSFMAVLALAWVGYGSISENLGAGFAYYMIPMMFVCYVICGVFVDSKAAHYVAQWIISRKICAGRPELVIASVFVVALVIGLFGTGFAGIFIVWSFIYSLADAMGYDKKTNWIQYLSCVICLIVIQGGQCFPFYSGAIVYNAIFSQGTGLELPFVGFVVVNVAIDVAITLAFYLILLFIIRPDFSKFKNEESKDIFAKYRGVKMTWDQKWGFGFLVAYIVLLTLPNVLPDDWALLGVIGKLEGVLGTSIFLAVLATLIRRKDGKTYYDLAKGSTEHISWHVMWMIIATIPLANAFQADECGILPTVMGFLQPLLGNMNPILYAICCMILVGVVTQVVHNLVLAIVFVPIFCNMMISMGGNPFLVYILVYWGLNLAFMTPAASMNAVIMHGNEHVDTKWAYGSGAIILVAGMIVTTLVGWPLVSIFMPY